ncbi:MAG: hypothetical protein ABI181_07020 [Mycobacteriaceae bacterium]
MTPLATVRARWGPTAWVALGWVVFVALTLGTSLAGRAVFASTDLLQQWAPWNPGTAYDVTNRLSRDVTDSLFPSYAQITARLGQGDIPGWTELTGPGQPLASAPSMPTLTPTVWPYLFLPLHYAPAVVKLAQLAVGAAGMILLLRRWGTRCPAALLAGMVYATSGFFVSWANFPQASVAAFIPALLWSVERLVQRVDPSLTADGRLAVAARWAGAVAPVALVVACLFLGGFPAVAAWSLYAAGAYALVRLLHRPWGSSVLRLAAAGLGVGLGLALSAVQMLPFITHLGTASLDYRADEFTYTSPPSTLITTLLPRVMASDLAPFTAPPQNAIEYNSYLGSAAVLLVMLALVLPRPPGFPRRVLGYLVVTTVVLVMLIWFQNPLVTWMGHLPVFSGNPVGRLRSVLFVGLSALAGLGADALLRGHRPGRRAGTIVVGGLGVVVVLAGVVSWFRFGRFTGYSTAVVDTAVALGAVVVVGALLAAGRRVHPERVLLPVLVALVCAQSVLGTGFYWNTTDQAHFYPQRDSLDYLRTHQGLDRVTAARGTMRPSVPALYGVRMLDSHTFIPDEWAALLRGLNTEEASTDYFETPTITQLPSASAAQLAVPGLDQLSVSLAVAPASAPVLGTPVGGAALGSAQTGIIAGGVLSLEPGRSVRTTINPTDLRALRLELAADSPDDPAGSHLDVTVAAADGTVLATGSQFGRSLPAGYTDVALVGDNLRQRAARGPWTVTVHWEGSGLLTLTGGDGVPALVAITPRADGLRLVYAGEGVVIYHRTTALPRIRWASRTLVVADEAARVRTVARIPLDPATVVLGAPGARTDVGSTATVDVTEDTGDTLTTRVDATGAGYLVMADWMAPGDWTATVDGRAARLVVADQALSAVPVPAGAHTIAVRYTPRGQRAGLLLSGIAGLALLGAGVLCVAEGARARRRRRAGAVRVGPGGV